MENNILINRGEFPGQGPAEHLRFVLVETSIPIAEGATTSQQYAFFSLRQAFCHLLGGNLEQADLRLARQKGLPYYSNRGITSTPDRILYGKIVAMIPGSSQANAPSGIYLQSDFSSDELRRMTGIPFPASSQLPDDFLIPLLSYNADFTSTIPTAHYEAIQAYVQQFLQHTQSADEGMDFPLTFKGEFLHAKSQGLQLYVERHYYDNLYEPVKQLLLTDPLMFDGHCADNEHEMLHHYAYITRPGRQDLISINVMPIADALDGAPTAGIYLHQEEDIENLEHDTGISLQNANFYDQALPFLMLAEYVYERGLRLVPDKGIVELARNLEHPHNNDQQLPHSPYVLNIAYDFTIANPAKETLSTAWEVHHYPFPEKALFKLLATDLHLLGDPATLEEMPYRVTSAQVCDQHQQRLAFLQLAPAGEQDPATLHLVIEAAMADRAPATFQALTLLFTGHLEVHGQPKALLIPVAHYNEQGQWQDQTNNQEKVFSLLASIIAEQPSQTRAGELSQASTAAAAADYHIELTWSEPAGPGTAATTRIHMPDLGAAHQYLQQMHPQLFLHTDPAGPRRHILRANLVDSDTGQPIVSRFYHPATVPPLPAGFYLQYQLDHPACNQLTPGDYGNSSMVEAASSLHQGTYVQHLVLGVPLTSAHPRTLMDNEGLDTSPGMKP